MGHQPEALCISGGKAPGVTGHRSDLDASSMCGIDEAIETNPTPQLLRIPSARTVEDGRHLFDRQPRKASQPNLTTVDVDTPTRLIDVLYLVVEPRGDWELAHVEGTSLM